MSENGTPLNMIPASRGDVANWGNSPLHPPAIPRPPLERPISAIRRYKRLVLGVIGLAIVGGVVATRFVNPKYEVRATIWIEPETPVSATSGPIRSRELLNASAWVELLHSYRIADAVVRKLALYVKPRNSDDFWMFSHFAIADRFVPGDYELKIDRTQKRWHLALKGGALPD
ncbi:MAG: hypothetical protein M3P12_15210, partial [Gemmatimonadota bacterium]|nr:hypothetical protein [Gemmatimonadota bacterium]